jgi:hypothetical protein
MWNNLEKICVPLSEFDKINGQMVVHLKWLVNAIQGDLIDIYTHKLATAIDTVVPNTQTTFLKIVHILDHKLMINKMQKTLYHVVYFPSHSEIKL